MSARQLTTDGRRISASLYPLAELAMREAGAQAYALFRQTNGVPETTLAHLGGGGIRITEESLASIERFRVASFTLRSGNCPTGLLVFVFEGHSLTSAAKSRLCPLAAAIGQLWELQEDAGHLTSVATRIGELEAELADSKIASRIAGFLQSPASAVDLVEAAARHVQNVLSRSESAALLEKRRQELEAELEERTLATKAKTFLQTTGGLSEDAAHLHLRMLSRKTRRPLRDVALDVLARSSTTV